MLREDPKKGVFVEGLTEFKADSIEEMMNFFLIGMSQRSTAETRLNERSSRSHGIFTIKIESCQESDTQGSGGEQASWEEGRSERREGQYANVRVKRSSVVHFVDLAGSERQFESDSDRLKETCQINKSLVVLSNVISSLCEKNKRYVHFRDSK
jgi:hypothetical protein